MSSPNYDAINVRLSRLLEDKVTSATADGNAYTSAFRDLYLNAGIRNFIMQKLKAGDKNAIRQYIVTVTGALASNVLGMSAFTYLVNKIMSVYDTTVSKMVFPLPSGLTRYDVENAVNAYTTSLLYYEPISGSGTSDLYIIGAGTADNVKIEYVKQHTDLVAGGSTQTVVSDTAFTYSGTLVTGFTGVLASHLGGTFVGKDSLGNTFVRTIILAPVGSQFTVDSSIPSAGAGTNGYIIPLNAGDIQIDSAYWEEVLNFSLIEALKDKPTDRNVARISQIEKLILA